MNQIFSDWELLLVDDGSPDASGALCDKLSLVDARIKSYHKPNGGAASARNLGVKQATGDYLLFLDSDDYWDSADFLEKVSNKLQEEKPDICLFGCMDEFAGTNQRIQSRGHYDTAIFQSQNKGEILNHLISAGEFPGSCWIMAVNREFYAANHIEFPEGNRAEDIDWLMQILTAAGTFSCLTDAFYVYNKNQSTSITGTAGLKSIQSILSTANKWSVLLQKAQYKDCYTALNSYLVFEFMTAVLLYDGLSKEEKKCCAQDFKNTKLDFAHVLGRKIQLSGLFYRIFGLKLTSKILNAARKAR